MATEATAAVEEAMADRGEAMAAEEDTEAGAAEAAGEEAMAAAGAAMAAKAADTAVTTSGLSNNLKPALSFSDLFNLHHMS